MSSSASLTEGKWFPELPDGWRTLPVRVALTEKKQKNSGQVRDAYLSLISGVGVVPYEEKGDLGNKKSDDLSNCKLVDVGDFVINSMNFLIGAFGRSEYQGVCSPVYVVAKPDEKQFDPRFLMRIFQVQEFQRHVGRLGKGIMALRMAIGWDELKNQLIPVPPLPEQERLANFLDAQLERIEALIRAKEELEGHIEELERSLLEEEMVQAMAGPTMALRRALRSLSQGWSPVAENYPATNGEWGVLKLSAVKYGLFSPQENKALTPGDPIPSELRLRAGDLLVTRANTPELVGTAALVEEDSHNLIPSDLIYTLRLNEEVLDPRFLLFFLLSPQGRSAIEVDARGSSLSMVKISQEHIRSWRVPAISKDAQTRAVARIRSALAPLQSLRVHVKAHIERLREYRSSLISAAVTGQLNVTRNAEAP